MLLLTYGSSEYSWLSDEDIWRLTAELAEEVAGRSLFITSTGWWHPTACRKFLKHAHQAGADAVKVQINTRTIADAGSARGQVFSSYHDRVQDAAPIPLLLWCDSRGAGTVPVDTIAELAQRPQIVGIKNDEDPFYYYYDLIRATADQDFAVISGGLMRNFVFGYQVGSAAYLCAVAPFRPDIALKFYDLLVAHRFDEAWQMVFRYEDPWLKTVGEMNWLLSIKSALNLHGLFPNDRLGGRWQTQTDDEQEKIQQCLERVFGPIEKLDL